MSAFSPNPEEHFNAETIEALRQALQAALQQPVSPWNRETQGPFHAGRLLHEPVSVAEGGPGTKSNPTDLTATTSSTSSCRSFSVGSHSGLRSSMGMDAFQEPDESPSPERARRSVERSRSRSWDAETQESLASGSFADFDALEASGVGLPTLWGNEQEYSESRDEEDEFTPVSDHSPERMWLKEDNDLAITDENVWPNISLISQTMGPLVGVIIPVRIKKRTHQEGSGAASLVEEKRPTRKRLRSERAISRPLIDEARAKGAKEQAEAFAYLDSLPTMNFRQSSFDPFFDHIIHND